MRINTTNKQRRDVNNKWKKKTKSEWVCVTNGKWLIIFWSICFSLILVFLLKNEFFMDSSGARILDFWFLLESFTSGVLSLFIMVLEE